MNAIGFLGSACGLSWLRTARVEVPVRTGKPPVDGANSCGHEKAGEIIQSNSDKTSSVSNIHVSDLPWRARGCGAEHELPVPEHEKHIDRWV